jgi:hypothetical protein
MNSDEKAIRELVSKWLEASKTGDLATILGLMADDVVFMVPGKEPFGKKVFAVISKEMKDIQIEGTSDIVELEVLGDWEPRPFDRAFALFDPLLARATLVIEGYDILGGPRHVRHDESDARIEFARMPFDLGDDPARLRPASGLIGEIGVGAPHLVWRAPDRPRQQIADPPLQDAVGGKPDRILDVLGFEKLIDFWICETRVGSEIDARDLASISRDDGLQHAIPSVGAVDVAGTQSAAFQIAELVEYEERMIAVHS